MFAIFPFLLYAFVVTCDILQSLNGRKSIIFNIQFHFMNVEGRCFYKNFLCYLLENQLGNKMINLYFIYSRLYIYMSTLRSAVCKILCNISKDISDCYEHKLIKIQLVLLRYLLKPFMRLNLLNICITDLELLMNYCILSYIYNCKIITCQKSSS